MSNNNNNQEAEAKFDWGDIELPPEYKYTGTAKTTRESINKFKKTTDEIEELINQKVQSTKEEIREILKEVNRHIFFMEDKIDHLQDVEEPLNQWNQIKEEILTFLYSKPQSTSNKSGEDLKGAPPKTNKKEANKNPVSNKDKKKKSSKNKKKKSKEDSNNSSDESSSNNSENESEDNSGNDSEEDSKEKSKDDSSEVENIDYKELKKKKIILEYKLKKNEEKENKKKLLKKKKEEEKKEIRIKTRNLELIMNCPSKKKQNLEDADYKKLLEMDTKIADIDEIKKIIIISLIKEVAEDNISKENIQKYLKEKHGYIKEWKEFVEEQFKKMDDNYALPGIIKIIKKAKEEEKIKGKEANRLFFLLEEIFQKKKWTKEKKVELFRELFQEERSKTIFEDKVQEWIKKEGKGKFEWPDIDIKTSKKRKKETNEYHSNKEKNKGSDNKKIKFDNKKKCIICQGRHETKNCWYGEGICFNCGKKGDHKAAECRSKEKICFRCLKSGHIRKDGKCKIKKALCECGFEGHLHKDCKKIKNLKKIVVKRKKQYNNKDDIFKNNKENSNHFVYNIESENIKIALKKNEELLKEIKNIKKKFEQREKIRIELKDEKGRGIIFILDRIAPLNLFKRELMDANEFKVVRKSKIRVKGARKKIEVLGETRFDTKINNKNITIKGIIVDHCNENILSWQYLEKWGNITRIKNSKEKSIFIAGKRFIQKDGIYRESEESLDLKKIKKKTNLNESFVFEDDEETLRSQIEDITNKEIAEKDKQIEELKKKIKKQEERDKNIVNQIDFDNDEELKNALKSKKKKDANRSYVSEMEERLKTQKEKLIKEKLKEIEEYEVNTIDSGKLKSKKQKKDWSVVHAFIIKKDGTAVFLVDSKGKEKLEWVDQRNLLAKREINEYMDNNGYEKDEEGKWIEKES